MKIMLEQPSLLNAPSTPDDHLNTQDMADESQPSDFMDYLSSLLFNQQAANDSQSVDAQNLQTVSDDNVRQDENSNEALNNLLIEMSYLMNNPQPPVVKPENQLTGAASETLALQTMQLNTNKQTVKTETPTIPKTDTTILSQAKQVNETPSPEMVRMLTGDANTEKPALVNTVNQKILSENHQEINKLASKDKVEVKLNTDDLITNAQSPKSTVEHTKIANTKVAAQTQDQQSIDSLQNLSQWIQTKLNDKQVNNAIKLESRLNDLSVTGSGAASAPAKSAYEVNVSIEKSMSAADVNLTTYHANIKIYPPELGKITARLKMDKNSAELEVVAENRQVKALLETHIVALKEQFTSSNIQLDKINIVLQEPESNMNSAGKEKQQEKQAFNSNEPYVKDENAPKKTVTKQKNNASSNVDAYV